MLELGEQLGRQTDGFGLVVSRRAISDLQFHCRLLFLFGRLLRPLGSRLRFTGFPFALLKSLGPIGRVLVVGSAMQDGHVTSLTFVLFGG